MTEQLPLGDVWLIRHAQTEWSLNGRHTGRTDLPLTAEGEAHARALRDVLGARRFATVLCSPLSRALDTARLAGLGDAAVTSADLMEWDYGDYEGLTTVQIRAQQPGWTVFEDGCPGGESPDDVAARADRVVQLACESPGDVAVFSHGHFLRVLGARWIAQPPGVGARLALGTGAVCVLGAERENRVIRSWGTTR